MRIPAEVSTGVTPVFACVERGRRESEREREGEEEGFKFLISRQFLHVVVVNEDEGAILLDVLEFSLL
jgi:hypothetical protein